MARIRINTRNHTKEKPYLIIRIFVDTCMYVCEWDMCWRNFCNFPRWLKYVKSRSKIALFFKWAPFWNLISKKRKQLRFSEVKLSKLHQKDSILHGETRGNKNKLWIYSTARNITTIPWSSFHLNLWFHLIFINYPWVIESHNNMYKLKCHFRVLCSASNKNKWCN